MPVQPRVPDAAVTSPVAPARPVFYLHGFASSDKSTKATYLADRLRVHGIPLRCPDFNLPDFASLTMTRMLNQLSAETLPHDQGVTLIGSSLARSRLAPPVDDRTTARFARPAGCSRGPSSPVAARADRECGGMRHSVLHYGYTTTPLDSHFIDTLRTMPSSMFPPDVSFQAWRHVGDHRTVSASRTRPTSLFPFSTTTAAHCEPPRIWKTSKHFWGDRMKGAAAFASWTALAPQVWRSATPLPAGPTPAWACLRFVSALRAQRVRRTTRRSSHCRRVLGGGPPRQHGVCLCVAIACDLALATSGRHRGGGFRRVDHTHFRSCGPPLPRGTRGPGDGRKSRWGAPASIIQRIVRRRTEIPSAVWPFRRPSFLLPALTTCGGAPAWTTEIRLGLRRRWKRGIRGCCAMSG